MGNCVAKTTVSTPSDTNNSEDTKPKNTAESHNTKTQDLKVRLKQLNTPKLLGNI